MNFKLANVLVYDVPSLYQTTLTSETLKSSVKCVVRTHLTKDVKVVSRQSLKSSDFNVSDDFNVSSIKTAY